MHNFGMIYRYEMKKILRRKIVWISAVVMLLIIIFTISSQLFGDYYVEGTKQTSHYQIFQENKNYEKQLDGRKIDQKLLKEMQEVYKKVPMDARPYVATKEYQMYAMPYSAIFQLVEQVTDMTPSEIVQWTVNEQDLYARRQKILEEVWKNYGLTQEEKAFWRTQEEALEKPIIFRYKEAYQELFNSMDMIGLMTLIVIAVCLSGIFPEEHVRKTDQMILSCKLGRKTVYWAKCLAGVSVSFLLSFLFAMTAFLTAYLLYGPEGFSADVRLIRTVFSYPLSAGGAVLISYGMMVAAGVFTGIFVMMLSEQLKSSIAALSIVVGASFLGIFFEVPQQYRILSQLWSYLPGNYVSVRNILNPRTVSLGGNILLSWQAVPVFYAFFGGIFAFLGKLSFVKYQISGK